MSWRVDLMSASVILAVVIGVLAAAYLLIQTFVVGSIGWSRLVTRTPDETHSQICRDDAGKTSARPAHGRDCPALRGPRRGISRHNAPSHQRSMPKAAAASACRSCRMARWSIAKGSCSMRRTTERPAREGYTASTRRTDHTERTRHAAALTILSRYCA